MGNMEGELSGVGGGGRMMKRRRKRKRKRERQRKRKKRRRRRMTKRMRMLWKPKSFQIDGNTILDPMRRPWCSHGPPGCCKRAEKRLKNNQFPCYQESSGD